MSADIFRKLAALGLTNEQIGGVLDIIDAQSEDRRAKGRERWRRWKENKDANGELTLANVSQHEQTLAVDSCAGDTRVDVKQITNNTHNKKDKNNNAAKPLSDLEAFRQELDGVLDQERINALCSIRRQKRAGFSAKAGKGLAAKLSKFPDPYVAADEMIVRGWVGIEPDWLEQRHRPQAPPRKKNIVDVIDELQEKANGRNSDHTFAAFGNVIDITGSSSDGRGIAPALRGPSATAGDRW